MTEPDIDRIATTFRRFGAAEAVENRSPLYQRLSEVVAADPALCELASHARSGQPAPNLLFAAVQFLLEDHLDDPLATFYPAFAAGREPGSALDVVFPAFCSKYRESILAILRERSVQTNEVRRSACLLPAFTELWHTTGAPLALIEIGPSAGLNLLFDRYAYDYGTGHTAGDPMSPVVLDCESRGATLPVGRGLPPVVSRTGIDLNPLDVRDEANLRWLKALVWPEHDDRRALLTSAATVVRVSPPRLLGGDVFELLPTEIANAPAGAAVCLIATFVLNQFSEEMRIRFRALLLEMSKVRDVHLVLMGVDGLFAPGPRRAGAETGLWQLHFSRGEERARELALCNPHGRWIDWHAQT